VTEKSPRRRGPLKKCSAEFVQLVNNVPNDDLPREIDYLRRHDTALRRIMDTVEMPDRLAENLLLFIRQNGGTLSKRRRQNEFKSLSDKEVKDLEEIVRDAFDGYDETPRIEEA